MTCSTRRHLFEGVLAGIILFGLFYAMPHERELGKVLKRAQDMTNVIDSLDEGIVATDSIGTITLFSKGAEKLFGVTSKDVVGKSFDWMLDQSLKERHRQILSNKTFALSDKTRVVDAKVLRYDGTEFWGRIHLKSFNTINGSYGFSARIHEIGSSVVLPTPIYPVTPPIIPQAEALPKDRLNVPNP